MTEQQAETLADLIIYDAFGSDPLTPSQRYEAIVSILRGHVCGCDARRRGEAARQVNAEWYAIANEPATDEEIAMHKREVETDRCIACLDKLRLIARIERAERALAFSSEAACVGGFSQHDLRRDDLGIACTRCGSRFTIEARPMEVRLREDALNSRKVENGS